MFRPESVLRTLGAEWEGKMPFELGTELFRRILAHPEGVEIARQRMETNLEDHVGFADEQDPPRARADARRRSAARSRPSRRVDPASRSSWRPDCARAGRRTRSSAIRPGGRARGRTARSTCRPPTPTALGIRDGDTVRVATNRGASTMPAQVDAKLMAGHVWMPNGFGMVSADGMVQGANQNELTDVADRDPFTGIPHHRYVRCRVARARGAAQ